MEGYLHVTPLDGRCSQAEAYAHVFQAPKLRLSNGPSQGHRSAWASQSSCRHPAGVINQVMWSASMCGGCNACGLDPAVTGQGIVISLKASQAAGMVPLSILYRAAFALGWVGWTENDGADVHMQHRR